MITRVVVENRRSCCSFRSVGLEVFVKDGHDVEKSCGVFTTDEETYNMTCNSLGNVVEIFKKYNAATYDAYDFLINLVEMYVYGHRLLERTYVNNM